MKFLRIFSPSFMARLDRYLLANYPVLWATRIHYTLFWAFALYSLIFLTSYLYPLGITNAANSFAEQTLVFTLPVSVFSFIMWFIYITKFRPEASAAIKSRLAVYQKFIAYYITVYTIITFPFLADICLTHRIARLETREIAEHDHSVLTNGNKFNQGFSSLSTSENDSTELTLRYCKKEEKYRNAPEILILNYRHKDLVAEVDSYLVVLRKYDNNKAGLSSAALIRELLEETDTANDYYYGRSYMMSYPQYAEDNNKSIRQAHTYLRLDYTFIQLLIAIWTFIISVILFTYSYCRRFGLFIRALLMTLGLLVGLLCLGLFIVDSVIYPLSQSNFSYQLDNNMLFVFFLIESVGYIILLPLVDRVLSRMALNPTK